MKEIKKYKSEAFATIHETMDSLHQIGAIDQTTMDNFDQASLQPITQSEKAAAFRAWADSHRGGLPLLTDEAISRESIYNDERL